MPDEYSEPSQRRHLAKPRVLVADDEPRLVRSLVRQVEHGGYEVLEAQDAAHVRQQLGRDPEVVLLDLNLGESSGLELISEIRGSCPHAEIVVITGHASVDSVVACMRAGAFDYLEKPFGDQQRVLQTLQRARDFRGLRMRNRELEGELDRRVALDGMVARSQPMKRVVDMIRDLSSNESNVLIEAESGTGKELTARALHSTSPRRDGPFVPVDCGALPEGIIEAELFGYERGAFTGAVRASEGLFRSATGGTLFLDEIGELPVSLQARLLRVIQEREVRPLGATESIPVDVRLIAATNRDLAAEVTRGSFRSDLFYRLRVVSIELPPLRDRPEDIPELAKHFLSAVPEGSPVNGIEPDALQALIENPWPGNVRELENCIEAALALSRGPSLSRADLRLGDSRTPSAAVPEGIELSLEAYERRCLLDTLRRVDGDVKRAAHLLGIGRSTLYRKLVQHGIH